MRSNHGNQQSPQDRRRSSATLSPTPPCCPRALSSPTFASDVLRRLARARPCAPLLPWSLVREDDRWPSPGVTRSEPHSGTGNVSPPADRSGASGWNAHPAEQTSPPLVWTGQLSASNASGRPGTLAAPARCHTARGFTRLPRLHVAGCTPERARCGQASPQVRWRLHVAERPGRCSQVRPRPVAAGPGVVASALAWRRARLTLRRRDGPHGRALNPADQPWSQVASS